VGVPLPYGVYFGGKSFYLSDLHIEGARKIFNTKGLRAKYLFSIGWRLVPAVERWSACAVFHLEGLYSV